MADPGVRMSTTLDAVTSQALALPPEERAQLLERLADSVLPLAPLHPAWDAEIARRVAALDAGSATAVPAAEVLSRVRRLIEQSAARR